MIEEQAMDRIHRIGQKKPVTTIRYIVKDSFEEVNPSHPLQTGPIDHFPQNIKNMQARKKHLADLSMSQPRLSGAELSQSGLEVCCWSLETELHICHTNYIRTVSKISGLVKYLHFKWHIHVKTGLYGKESLCEV